VFKIVVALNILLEQEKLPITYTAEGLRTRFCRLRNLNRVGGLYLAALEGWRAPAIN
jgi:hypothetical protein